MAGSIETVAFCEREDYAQRVLKKHWPDVPICDDIHTLKGSDYGPIDLVTGGFPCQPYSLAGERRGNDDDRALWPQMLRVIREARPTWVIGENVPGIISLALDGVLADLEREGYACETFVLPACAVDAKHRRSRVWIVAHDGLRESMELSGGVETCRSRTSNRRETLAVSNRLSGRAGTRRQDGPETGDHGEVVSDRDEPRLAKRQGERGDDGEEQQTAERVHRWVTEPDVGRVAHGIPSRVDRLKGLGNAIVPQVAAALLSKIVEVHYGTVARHNSDYTTRVAY
jgi:DNA (cytosine-5)-methyltransferase 1